MSASSPAQPAANPTHVRSDPRVGIDVPVDVYSSELSGPLPGRARDLSVAGLCVATASPFALKSVTRVVLRLPQAPVDVEAEGRWQREVDGEGVVLTGIAFSGAQSDVTERLWDIVLERAKKLTRFLYAGTDLAGFGLDEAMGIAQVTRVRDLEPGATVYRQGRIETGEDSIFVVVRGHVVLQTRVRDARDTPIERIGTGSLMGGLPLIAGGPPAESAIADTNVRLLEIDRNSYQYLLAAKPWLALRLAQTVTRVQGERIQRLLARVRDQL